MLTDNGCIYTAKYRGGKVVMETLTEALGITYKHSSPYHPQTCGKVESPHDKSPVNRGNLMFVSYAVGMRVCLTTDIAAPIDRVWRALTIPEEVRVWDGVDPLDVPIHYPQAGQHARWRSAFGPLRLTLHDRIREIDDGLRMAATIDIAFVHVDEEYRLAPTAKGGTTLITDDSVRSHIPGLNWLALQLTRANVQASMARLKAFCEQPASS